MNSDTAPFLISTADFAPADRLEGFRETFGRKILNLEITPLSGDDQLAIDMRVRRLPSMSIADGASSPIRAVHLSKLADTDDLIFTLVRSGKGDWTQKTIEATVGAGQGILTASGVAGSFVTTKPCRLLNFRFNRQKIVARISDVDAALGRPVSADNQALVLLTNYVDLLSDEAAMADPMLCLAIDDHLHDLVAVVLGATRDAAELARFGGIRAARMRAVKDDIIACLTRRDLTIDFIAGRHGISARYVRTLFDGADTTFTDFVLAQRLERVHRHLVDPRYQGLSISAIVFESGFGDLSYFNQSFRRRYGATPSDVRAMAAALHRSS